MTTLPRTRLSMATLTRKHPLLAYYVVTFALSWGGFLLVVGPARWATRTGKPRGSFCPRSWSCSRARASRACC